MQGHRNRPGSEGEPGHTVLVGLINLRPEGLSDQGGVVVVGHTDGQPGVGLGGRSQHLAGDGKVQVLMREARSAVIEGGPDGEAAVTGRAGFRLDHVLVSSRRAGGQTFQHTAGQVHLHEVAVGVGANVGILEAVGQGILSGQGVRRHPEDRQVVTRNEGLAPFEDQARTGRQRHHMKGQHRGQAPSPPRQGSHDVAHALVAQQRQT